ncbi:MAG: hypothetical protein ABI723_03655 [Bacteroidia bacterium]
MEWLLILFYILLFAFVISKWSFFKNDSITTRLFILVFVLKVLSSYFQKYLYDNFGFGGDADTLFGVGKTVSGFLKTNPGLFLRTLTGTISETDYKLNFTYEMYWKNDDVFFNDNQTIIRINALLNFITFGCFRVNAVIFCFFSTVGFNGLYKFFSSFFVEKRKEVFAVSCLIPSAIFWCSNISKESWLLFCLGLFLYAFSMLTQKFSIRFFVLMIVMLVFLAFIKIYFLLAILPALLSFLISQSIKTISPVLIFPSLYSIGFIGLFSLNSFDFMHYLQLKQHSFQYLAEWSQSTSTIAIPDINGSVLNLISNIPIALWNILMRPYLWEMKSALWLPAIAENILVLVLLIVGVIGFRWNKERAAISLFCLFFAVSLLVLIGLTTPVIGALVRYKAPLLPFLLMFFVFHFDLEKLKTRVKFL